MRKDLSPAETPAGVAGLGLMGTSIAACLLAAGHRTVGVDKDPTKRRSAKRRLHGLLRQMRTENLLSEQPEAVIERFSTSASIDEFSDAGIVIEAVFEDGPGKRSLLTEVEAVVLRQVPIGCNTSAIPISILQQGSLNPKRILGIHWAEPAHITRFLEIICGKETSLALAKRVLALSRAWGKEPTFLRRDIRGFITNRCFYALMREALYLVENGYATVADIDRSLRNDLGYWITFAGPFRFMDLTGIPAYAAVAEELFPDLNTASAVSPVLTSVARSGALGVANAKGFYQYTPRQAQRWQKAFLEFSYRIRQLAHDYPEDIGDCERRPRRTKS